MTLSLDGASSVSTNSGTSIALSLTTTLANDIIVVIVSNCSFTSSTTVSSVTSPGLSFAKRASYSGLYGGGPHFPDELEVWWALASSPLSSQAITVTLAANITAVAAAFGVNGVANTAAPWDSNASLGTGGSSHASNSLTDVTFSTTSPNCFVIYSIGAGQVGGTGLAWNPPAGFSNIVSGANYMAAAYKVVSSPQTGVTLAATTPYAATYDGQLVFVDALVGSIPAPPVAASSFSLIGFPPVAWDMPQGKIHRRQIAEAANRLNRGKFNATLDVTLNANTGATLISDNRIGHTSAVSPMMALSLSAGVAIAGGIWFDNPLAGSGSTTRSIIAHHNITADADKKIRFGIIG